MNRLVQVAASQEQQKQLREALHQSQEKLVNHAAEARHNSECSGRSSVCLSVSLCQPSFTCHAVALSFSVLRLCLTHSLWRCNNSPTMNAPTMNAPTMSVSCTINACCTAPAMTVSCLTAVVASMKGQLVAVQTREARLEVYNAALTHSAMASSHKLHTCPPLTGWGAGGAGEVSAGTRRSS